MMLAGTYLSTDISSRSLPSGHENNDDAPSRGSTRPGVEDNSIFTGTAGWCDLSLETSNGLSTSLHSPRTKPSSQVLTSADTQILKSPRSRLSNLCSKTESRKNKTKGKDDGNEKLLQECKRLKKQLARKAAALSQLEDLHQNLSVHSATKSEVSQTELQLECYEKRIDSKDKTISAQRKTAREQKRRIAYLEVKCRQHGIAIKESEKSLTDNDRQKDQSNIKHTSTNSTLPNNVTNSHNNNSCPSFFGESDDDSESSVWEEDLKDHDLERALQKIDGPDEVLSKSQSAHATELVSLTVSELPKHQKSERAEGNSSTKDHSWDDLQLSSLKNKSCQIPRNEENETLTGMTLEEHMNSPHGVNAPDVNDNIDALESVFGAPRTMLEDGPIAKNSHTRVPVTSGGEKHTTKRSKSPLPRTANTARRSKSPKNKQLESTRRSNSPVEPQKSHQGSTSSTSPPRNSSDHHLKEGKRPISLHSIGRDSGSGHSSVGQGSRYLLLSRPRSACPNSTGRPKRRTLKIGDSRTSGHKDRQSAVLNGLEQSLGDTMEFDALDLPLPPARKTPRSAVQ